MAYIIIVIYASIGQKNNITFRANNKRDLQLKIIFELNEQQYAVFAHIIFLFCK